MREKGDRDGGKEKRESMYFYYYRIRKEKIVLQINGEKKERENKERDGRERNQRER